MGCTGVLCIFMLTAASAIENPSEMLIGAEEGSKPWSVKAPVNCQSEFTRNTDNSWTFNYQFPRVTYGFSERNSKNTANLPVEIKIPDPVFHLEIMNNEASGHMFFLHATCRDGSVWSSRPLALNWTGQWKSLTVPSSEMYCNTKGKINVFEPDIVKLSLEVNQSMSSRLGASGFYRKGQIQVRNIRATSDKNQHAQRKMIFEGKVFSDKKTLDNAKSGTLALSPLETGKSRNYPMKTGVPFPEGVLTEIGKLQVLANGKECPAQTKILSLWPDGSIRVAQLEFSADLTGAVSYGMAYGENAKSKIADRKPICAEDDGKILVDAGGLSAKFSKSGGKLLDELSFTNAKGEKVGVFSTEGCKSVLRNKDDVCFPISGKTVEIEQSGPLSCVIKVSGIYALDGNKSGYSFSSRFYFMRGSKSIRCTFTFVNESGITDNPMPDISIEGAWDGKHSRYQLGVDGAQSGSFKGKEIQLFQDGAIYENQRVKYPFTISNGAETLGNGTKFSGFMSSENDLMKANIGIFECWQNNPKKITLSGESFAVYLSCRESCRNGTPRNNFYHGMSKTQQFMFGFDEKDTVLDFLSEPFLMPPAGWLCSSGVFGKMDAEDKVSFPLFEKTKDNWIRNFSVLPKIFGDQYGLRDFGDYFSDNPDLWMNLETAVGMALFRQFVRTGKKEYLSLARQSIMHYADIDTCHAPGLGRDKEKEQGAVYAHTTQHAGKNNTAERNLVYLQTGGGGHDWYSEAAYLYLLSGNERLRDCVVLHADATVYHIAKYFKEDHVLAREYAWPLKNLCSAYMISSKPEYLRASAKIMNFFSYWRDAFSTARLGNTLGQPAVCLEAIRDYYETTRDPLARELFKIAGQNMVDNVSFPLNSELPSDSLYNEDGRVMILDVLPDLYEITGKDEYVKKYVGYLYYYMQNRICDPTTFWCAPHFLKSMKSMGLKEPFSKPFLPIISALTEKASGKSTGEALIDETEDGDFTVSVSRVAAFRMGRVARGLVIGNWEGYPDSTENKMRTEEPRFTPEHFGHIRVISPDGKIVLDEKLKEYYSKTYTYKIPKDGTTGTYRVIVKMSDTLYHEILVDSSLPRLTLLNRLGFPNIGTVYFKVPEGKEFQVKVGPRKSGRYGGAVLYSPSGEIADEVYWAPSNTNSVFTLKGKGAGIWKLERAMFSTTSRMSLEGIPDILGASPEAFGK